VRQQRGWRGFGLGRLRSRGFGGVQDRVPVASPRISSLCRRIRSTMVLYKWPLEIRGDMPRTKRSIPTSGGREHTALHVSGLELKRGRELKRTTAIDNSFGVRHGWC
jgi:hypothetical protein